MYALGDEECKITRILDEIKRLAVRFHTRLYAGDVRLGRTAERTSSTCLVSAHKKEKEVRKALEGMKIQRAAGEDGITMDLLTEEGDSVLEKLPVLFSDCLNAQNWPLAWKYANFIPIHEM